jgi:hypothetical protein
MALSYLKRLLAIKGYFTTTLALVFPWLLKSNSSLIMLLLIMHYTHDSQFNRDDNAGVTIKLGAINRFTLGYQNGTRDYIKNESI